MSGQRSHKDIGRVRQDIITTSQNANRTPDSSDGALNAILCLGRFVKIFDEVYDVSPLTAEDKKTFVEAASSCVRLLHKQVQKQRALEQQRKEQSNGVPSITIQSAPVGNPGRPIYDHPHSRPHSPSPHPDDSAPKQTTIPNYLIKIQLETQRTKSHFQQLIDQAKTKEQRSNLQMSMLRAIDDVYTRHQSQKDELDEKLKEIQQKFVQMRQPQPEETESPTKNLRFSFKGWTRNRSDSSKSMESSTDSYSDSILAQENHFKSINPAFGTNPLQQPLLEIDIASIPAFISLILTFRHAEYCHDLGQLMIKEKRKMEISLGCSEGSEDIPFEDACNMINRTGDEIMSQFRKAYSIFQYEPLRQSAGASDEVKAKCEEEDDKLAQVRLSVESCILDFLYDAKVRQRLHTLYYKLRQHILETRNLERVIQTQRVDHIQHSQLSSDLMLDGAPHRYQTAIQYLARITQQRPSEQLDTINKVFQSVANEFESYFRTLGKDKSPAADDLVPLLNYVVCQAQPNQLSYVVEVLTSILPQRHLNGMLGYQLATLQIVIGVLISGEQS